MEKRSKLNYEEYQLIYKKREVLGLGIREISRDLGRSPSTISRFLRRDYDICPGMWRSMSAYEKSDYAWRERQKRKSRSRLRLKSERIRNLVCFQLIRRHESPESISRFLRAHGLIISGKSIYNFIKEEKQSLKEYLRLRGKPRRQRVCHPRSVFRRGAPEKKNIRLRPEILEEGHWEIDTVHSKQDSRGGVLGLKERKSLKVFFFIIPDLKAETVIRILLPFFQKLPSHMARTLTADNGSEFEELYKLEQVLADLKVYYCDPYKSWQKPAIENSNGELRWYYKKGTDFNQVNAEEFREKVSMINYKRRQSLGDRSANRVFNQLLKAA